MTKINKKKIKVGRIDIGHYYVTIDGFRVDMDPAYMCGLLESIDNWLTTIHDDKECICIGNKSFSMTMEEAVSLYNKIDGYLHRAIYASKEATDWNRVIMFGKTYWLHDKELKYLYNILGNVLKDK